MGPRLRRDDVNSRNLSPDVAISTGIQSPIEGLSLSRKIFRTAVREGRDAWHPDDVVEVFG
jgi:hypothetical protein